MKNKITICGHFGFKKRLSNGQTIKSINLLKELSRYYSRKKVSAIDTHGKFNTFLCFFRLVVALYTSSDIILMPAIRGIQVIVPFVVSLNCIFNKKIHYVVIGGWLPQFLRNHRKIVKVLVNVDCIYVETMSMKKELEAIGLRNVLIMPNFKEIVCKKKNYLKKNESICFRFCTFSRVMKEKGIEDAIKVIIRIHETGIKCQLDIFGPVENKQKNWFEKLISSAPEYIKYKGIVDSTQSANIISNYYGLLFPTYYDGEGFAGTIIDAFSCGVPVICSDWKYNCDIVKDNYTGYVFPSKNNDSFYNAILSSINDIEKWESFSENCSNEIQKYIPSNAIRVLLNNISFSVEG